MTDTHQTTTEPASSTVKGDRSKLGGDRFTQWLGAIRARPALISHAAEVEEDRWLSHGQPSRPLLGLPIARLIPQDIHSAFDYAGALTFIATGSRAASTPARV